jgi:hypothetical protein
MRKKVEEEEKHSAKISVLYSIQSFDLWNSLRTLTEDTPHLKIGSTKMGDFLAFGDSGIIRSVYTSSDVRVARHCATLRDTARHCATHG